jgi:Holliday junction resolvase RusA-like endonuclease
VATIEFIVVGVPRTPQTKKTASKKKWKDLTAAAAKEAAGSSFTPISSQFSVNIIYYYRETTELDVDGIGKLLLDSLIDIIIDDDRLAEQVLLRKTNQVGLNITNPPPILAKMLNEQENFVYVKIFDPPDHTEMPQ